MGKSDTIIAHIKENKYYSPSKCPWHHDRYCLLVLNNFDLKRYHCLFASHSIQWRAYSNTGSCDIPEQFYDVKLLAKEMGHEYVLPFAYAFRERSGYCIGLYELHVGLYGSNILTPDNLAETFYTMIVFLCAVCFRMGGNPPVFKFLSFLYTERHPVLADVGAQNAEKRNRLGNREALNKKKWSRFLKNRTGREVTRYLKLVRPDLFKKKCSTRSVCVLAETMKFDDRTHALICKSKKKSVSEILVEFMNLVPDERIKTMIAKWIESTNPS